MQTYVFDGTFDGLLTAVFAYFERKPGPLRLISTATYQPCLLGTEWLVQTETAKAARVWAGLQKRLTADWPLKYYAAFLSESEDAFDHLFQLAIYLFQQETGACMNFGNPHVLFIDQVYHKVHREKHRMEAFIRFRHTKDGIYYALVRPDFNVLPLIAQHFKDRYAVQQWLIYDEKRRYGLFYDLDTVAEISLEFEPDAAGNASTAAVWDADEALYSTLWKDYFKNANIPARNNPKLHLRHVPRRYWRYLTEKNSF
ncbi:MAG: TIGR03915 family putative DNA repair protein [Chitinophagaceae bacterium]|nr:TIGR03915 family putative DNA repair protein [Chitinophagaceae bacterium]